MGEVAFSSSVRFSGDPLSSVYRVFIPPAPSRGIAAITLDGNGVAWLTGWGVSEAGRRALRSVTDNFDSGVAPADTDVQAPQITLEGIDGDFDIPLDATLTAAIVAGTSTIIDWNV
jgi:hypothetical protein